MELQDIYFIAEIGAAISIVGSLVFVGMQLRQGVQANLAANAQDSLANWNESSLLLATDDRLLKSQQKGLHPDFEGLLDLDEDRLRFNYYMLAGMKVMENSFLQWQAGNLPSESWKSYRLGLVDMFVFNTYWLEYWEQYQRIHSVSFIKIVNTAIEEADARRRQLVEELSVMRG